MLDDLSERERRVLAAIVEGHVISRGPVASRTLADHLDLGVSPQTVRNIMGALADRGLIEKPHSSAGRIPTVTGLRFYVDALLRLEDPPENAAQEISSRIREAPNVGGTLDEAGRVLARLSRTACVVRAPKTENARLKLVDLVRLRDDAVLVILVTEEGLVQNRIVEMHAVDPILRPTSLDDMRLKEVARQVSAEVAGKTLEEARRHLRSRIDDARADHEKLADAIFTEAFLGSAPTGTDTGVTVEGERHLLDNADPKTVEKARDFLTFIETKGPLLDLLDEAARAPGVRIFIGNESGLEELAGLAVIATGYGHGEGIVGGLGVIGPMHVDFARIVPLVRFTADTLSRALGPDKGKSAGPR